MSAIAVILSNPHSNLIVPSHPRIEEALEMDASLREKADTSTPVDLERNVVSVPHRLSLAVSGMTCAACSVSITEMVSQISGVSQVFVNALNNSATMIVENKNLIPSVTEAIEDCGFGAELLEAEPLCPPVGEVTPSGPRTVSLQVHGMFCQ